MTVRRRFDKETGLFDVFSPKVTNEISDAPLEDLTTLLLENPGNKVWLEIVEEEKSYGIKTRAFSRLDFAYKDNEFTN